MYGSGMGVVTLFVVPLILCLLNYSATAPTKISPVLYLSQYGYMPPVKGNASQLLDTRTYKKAIEEFQAFAELKVTGEIDAKTLEMMSLSRCGIQDKVGSGNKRTKRYVLAGAKYKTRHLTYKITKYPYKLKRRDVDKEIQRAFKVWSGYTDLTFTPKRGPVHIEIRFLTGEHGDGSPFDGRGHVLAHAFYPQYGSATHFDDSETWTINSYRGTNLFQVAVHEFGHALGLEHSKVKQAVMNPFYTGYYPFFRLHKDDIDGIQRLYGKKYRS